MNDTAPQGQYCPACDGTGTLAHVRSGEHGASHVIARCSVCDGEGYIPFPKCRHCADTGYVHDAEADRFDRCACRPPLWVSPQAKGEECMASRRKLSQWEVAIISAVISTVLVALAELASAISKL